MTCSLVRRSANMAFVRANANKQPRPQVLDLGPRLAVLETDLEAFAA